MWTERTTHRLAALIAASVALHAGILVVMPEAMESPREPQLVEMTFAPLPPPSPPPEPARQPDVPPRAPAAAAPVRTQRAASPRPATRRAPAATPREAAPSIAATDAPADLTGVTLTNDSSPTGFAAPAGNGELGGGAIQARASGRGERSRAPTAGAPMVALANLSRPPRAPALDAALEHNYPAAARAAGTPGTAVVRARVLADGRIGSVRVLTASDDGFGDACRTTLMHSRWEPPLDAASRPVATEISYTCRFEVSR